MLKTPRIFSARGTATAACQLILIAALTTTWADTAAAQEEEAPNAAPATAPPDAGLMTDSQETDVEQQIIQALPELAPPGDPRRPTQVEELARRLTQRRAYCRATEYFEELEAAAAAAPTDNRSAAAQAYYMCANTRLLQGDPQQAELKLNRSIAIVGERPEHRDLHFKLALVRARKSMADKDLEGLRANLEQARQLGVDLGPGGGNRLADWAVPLINDFAKDIAVWSRALLDAGDRDLADGASRLAMEINPRERIADSVRRDLIMGGVVLPAVLGLVAVLLVIGLIYWWIRARTLRRISIDDGLLDDE